MFIALSENGGIKAAKAFQSKKEYRQTTRSRSKKTDTKATNVLP
jgi:hypothetical protein